MDFRQIKEKIDSICKAKGLEEYKMVFSGSSGLSASATGRAISDTSIEVSSALTFTAVVNGRGGSSSTNIFGDEALEAMVDRAMDNGSFLEGKSKCYIFEGSPKYESIPECSYKEPEMAQIVDKVLDIQNQMLDADPRVQDGSDSTIFSEKRTICLANSKGLILENTSGSTGYYQSAVVREGEEVKLGMDISVCDIDEIKLDNCVNEAIAKLGSGPTKTRKASIVMSSDCMRMMLSAFSPIFFGRYATLGMSLLKNKEGQSIASPVVTLVDDPFEPSSPCPIQFDADGVATYRKNIIEKGVLNTLLYNISSAEEAGKKTTGNSGPFLGAEGTSLFSFYLEAGDKTEDELYALAGDDGICVKEMKGLHAGANAATGDFSIECAGFEIEGGKLGKSVTSFTISGNFYEMLKNIEALSNEVEFSIPHGYTRLGSPCALIKDISIAG